MAWHGMERKDKARKGKERQDKTMQGKARKTRKEKARQGKARNWSHTLLWMPHPLGLFHIHPWSWLP